MSHQEFIESNPILRMACGTAVTLAAEDGKLAEVARRIAAAVPARVPAASTHDKQPVPASPPPPQTAPTRPYWAIAAAVVASAGLAILVLIYSAPVKTPEPEASVGTSVSPSSTAPNPPPDRGDSRQPEVQKLPESAKTPAETTRTPRGPTRNQQTLQPRQSFRSRHQNLPRKKSLKRHRLPIPKKQDVN